MQAQLTISLAAIVANYQLLCDHVGANVAGVVKANAYGLGAISVAEALARAGCREFFVATTEEGMRLRDALPQATIYVLNGVTPATAQATATADLTPVLNALAQIDCWNEYARPAALHIDTGMQRLGLPPDEVKEALHRLRCPITLLVSHFARADEQDPESTQTQVSAFEAVLPMVRQHFPDVRISMSNSAATIAGGVGDDLVRGGIALYGVNPFTPGAPNPTTPVVRVSAPLLQVREIDAGTPVGYGGTYIAERRMRVGTVGIGFADGLPRLLSNRGRVWIDGQYAPIVGRVSMDLLQIDLSQSPDIELGAEVEVIGAHLSFDEVAEHAETIGYEVLTGLDSARRLARSYIDHLFEI